MFFSLVGLGFSQVSFPGLEAWTHGQTVGLAGGGYLFSINNEFRNAAMLPDSGRNFKINLVRYPAGINGQSIITNGKIKGHRFGLKINRLNFGLFEGRDINNQITGDYSAGDIHLQIAYAKPSISGRVVIGINGGLFFSSVENVKASALTISPGVVFYSRLGDLGFSLQNYGYVINSYTDTADKLLTSIVASFARGVPKLPLMLEVDYAYFMDAQNPAVTFSGILYLKNGLMIKTGTSTKRESQVTDVSFVKNLFADVGLGLSYEFEDILFDLNTYTYGPGGFVFAIGLSIRY